jgi:hypothetical protein
VFIGRYQLGDEVELAIRTTDLSSTPTLPTNPPRADVYNSSGSVVFSSLMPIKDRYRRTSYFQLPVYLGAEFSTGDYQAVIHYDESGTHVQELSTFYIAPGGSALGTVITLHHFRHPVSEFLLAQTNAGKLQRLRNPT